MKDSNEIALGPTLKRLLEERGRSMSSLSKEAKVARATLSGWMNKARPRDLGELRRVAKVLGVTLEFLIFGEEDKDLAAILNGAARRIELNGYYHITLSRLEGTADGT
jgi:transcriptional regulator with XRE-family HTH domain